MNKKILLYGYEGFLGRYVYKELCRKGWQILLIKRKEHSAQRYKTGVVCGIEDPISGEYILDEEKLIDVYGTSVVLNMYWYTKHIDYLSNVEKNQYSMQQAIRLANLSLSIKASTYVVVGSGIEIDQRALFESNNEIENVHNAYTFYKVSAMRMLKWMLGGSGTGLKWLRVFNVFGYGEQSSKIYTQLKGGQIKFHAITNRSSLASYMHASHYASLIVNELAGGGAVVNLLADKILPLDDTIRSWGFE